MLAQISSPDVHVYTVYLPILQADQEASVPSALRSLPDDRVSFYWDQKEETAQAYSRILKLRPGQPAWDVYLAFGRNAEWQTAPPDPDYWMHQLGGQPLERRLDGPRFAEVIKRLLQEVKK